MVFRCVLVKDSAREKGGRPMVRELHPAQRFGERQRSAPLQIGHTLLFDIPDFEA